MVNQLRTGLGQVLGLVMLGAVGGVILVFAFGSSIGLLGIFIGLFAGYPTVLLLMRVPRLRPALRWLFPYEAWTGEQPDA